MDFSTDRKLSVVILGIYGLFLCFLDVLSESEFDNLAAV